MDKDKLAEPSPKAGPYQKKIMLCVRWNESGIIHHEFLQPNQTVTAAVYAEQLLRLNSELMNKRPALVHRKKLFFHRVNARHHTAKLVTENMKEFNWELMPHPTYSPDLAPSDYDLFRGLGSFLTQKKSVSTTTYTHYSCIWKKQNFNFKFSFQIRVQNLNSKFKFKV